MYKHEYADYHTMEVAASPDTVTSVPTMVYGIHVETDGSNNATLVLNDGASGTEVITHVVTGADNRDLVIFPVPVMFRSGLEITLSGTASRAVVFYRHANE